MKRTRRAAYTLVEVVIVLMVVTVLAAILFGVFARVREKSRQATCSGNLRQIGLAMQQYVQDHDGAYPSAHDFNGENLKEGAFGASYVKSPQIFWCPSGQRPYPNTYSIAECSDGTTAGDIYPVQAITSGQLPASYRCNIFFSNYTYNTTLLNIFSVTTGRFSGVKEWKVTNASDTIVSSDRPSEGRWRKVWGSGCPDVVNGGLVNGAHQPTIHSDGAQYLFADGHVKWLDPEAAAKVQCSSALSHVGNTGNT